MITFIIGIVRFLTFIIVIFLSILATVKVILSIYSSRLRMLTFLLGSGCCHEAKVRFRNRKSLLAILCSKISLFIINLLDRTLSISKLKSIFWPIVSVLFILPIQLICDFCFLSLSQIFTKEILFFGFLTHCRFCLLFLCLECLLFLICITHIFSFSII